MGVMECSSYIRRARRNSLAVESFKYAMFCGSHHCMDLVKSYSTVPVLARPLLLRYTFEFYTLKYLVKRYLILSR